MLSKFVMFFHMSWKNDEKKGNCFRISLKQNKEKQVFKGVCVGGGGYLKSTALQQFPSHSSHHCIYMWPHVVQNSSEGGCFHVFLLKDNVWSLWWVEVLLYVHRNHRFIRDGSPGRPPRLSHSFWALNCGGSGPMLLYLHRDHKDY